MTAGPGTVLARAGRAEWSRIWSVRSSWILAGVLTVAVVGIGSLIAIDLRGDTAPGDEFGSVWDVSLFTTLFALFGVIALSVVAATADHSTGGIVPSLQWTPRRPVLLAARVTTIAATTTGLAVLLVAVVGLVVSVVVPQLDVPVGDGASTLGTVAFVCGSGALLGVGLGLATRSTAAALVSALALMLVLPLVMGNLPFDWANTLAERLPGAGALFLIFGESPLDTMTTTSARLTLGAWALSALVAGGLRLLRSDANR